jgi:hypothetical protein
VRLALLLAAAWVVLLLATFGRVLATLFWNADVAAPLVIGDLFQSAPDGATVTLANYPWYVTLWLELLTRHFPFHRQLWEVGPWIGSLAAIALLACTTARVAGRWAAAIVAFVLVCTGSNFLYIQFSPSVHGTTVFYACVLDAFLVSLATHGGRIGGRPRHLVAAALVAVVVAAGLASDKLLYAAGLMPFLVAGLLVARLASRAVGLRIAATTVAVVVGAVVGSRIIISTMHGRHVVAASYPITFAVISHLGENALDAVQSIAFLFNGNFDRNAVTARSLLTFACAVVVVVALVAAARFSLRWARGLVQPLKAGSVVERGEPLPRTAHLGFWILATALPLVAFVLTSVAGENVGRYLVSCGFGVATILALAAANASAARRTAITLGACVIVLASVISIAVDFDPSAGDQMARDVLPFVEGEGLTKGYAAYWTAGPLTWRSRQKVQVVPVLSCPRAPHGLCTYYLHTISSWYQPRPGERTFLIVDHRYGPPSPGQRLGGTQAVVDFKHYSIYVYDYDIGSNISDWHLYTRPS